jgi:predicted  nucleic acid-binding Zn-ribbon protein
VTSNLSSTNWPQKRLCAACGRVFFAFSPLRETCFPQCGSNRLDANNKHHEDVATPSESRAATLAARAAVEA